jgi:two-component system cell cycle sensor histidine kinase/response regulator CckA
MPGLSGLEVITRVKRHRRDLPCILCTGYGENVTEDTARRSGASAYFHKPIDISALEATLEELLGDRVALTDTVRAPTGGGS